MVEWLQFIQYSALQVIRELLREASRSGKTIEQLLSEAEAQTNLNREKADALMALLKSQE
jgi:hypothetical protein